MIQSICTEKGFSCSFNVCASEMERKLWIEVRYLKKDGDGKFIFPADKYGEALDFYNAKCDELRNNQ